MFNLATTNQTEVCHFQEKESKGFSYHDEQSWREWIPLTEATRAAEKSFIRSIDEDRKMHGRNTFNYPQTPLSAKTHAANDTFPSSLVL